MSRPIEYHPENVVEKAKTVFWKQGFDLTSIDDLTAATGMGRGSLYNAFGSKRAVYLSALEHYHDHEISQTVEFLHHQSTPRDAIGGLFDAVIRRAEGNKDRRGCLLCNAAIENAGRDETVSRLVQHYYSPLRDAFQELLRKNMPASSEHADHLLALYMGLQAMLRGGYPAATLGSAVTPALSLLVR